MARREHPGIHIPRNPAEELDAEYLTQVGALHFFPLRCRLAISRAHTPACWRVERSHFDRLLLHLLYELTTFPRRRFAKHGARSAFRVDAFA